LDCIETYISRIKSFAGGITVDDNNTNYINNNFNQDVREKLSVFYDCMISMSSDTGFNKFFVRSRSHLMVTVLVASRYTDFFSFEKLCNKIPNNVASRSTIKSILDDGVKQNYYDKNECPEDRRIQLYKLSSENFKFIEDWVGKQHHIFK
jgi:hypothetical protein